MKRYWLKLSEHFFDDDNVIVLESMPNGEKYIIVWMKLLLKTLKSPDGEVGVLRFNDHIPYTPELLSKALRCDIDTVKVALHEFVKLRMIEVSDDGTIYIEAVQRLIGRESESAERVRAFRERKKRDELPAPPKVERIEEPQKEIALPHGAAFAEAWATWLTYRKQRRISYKSELSVQAALDELSKYDEQVAIDAIKTSIASGWQGLFPGKGRRKTGGSIQDQFARTASEL